MVTGVQIEAARGLQCIVTVSDFSALPELATNPFQAQIIGARPYRGSDGELEETSEAGPVVDLSTAMFSNNQAANSKAMQIHSNSRAPVEIVTVPLRLIQSIEPLQEL